MPTTAAIGRGQAATPEGDRGRIAGVFTKSDVNGDGNLNLTETELQAGHQEMMGEQPR